MALLPGRPCWACKGKVWWISVHGARVCNRCHPPATPSLVVVLVAIGTRAGKRIASVLTRPASGTPIRESDTPGIVQRLAPGSRLLWTNPGSHPVAHHYLQPRYGLARATVRAGTRSRVAGAYFRRSGSCRGGRRQLAIVLLARAT